MSKPSIPEFFTGLEVFVTGGTGFMGKVLIEKLLRSCPGVKAIYVLIRSKKGKTAQERLAVLKDGSIFERLRKENPEYLDKLYAIDGDVSALRLGLSDANIKLLENVNIIFHVAASVRFDDDLKEAIIMNTRGTQEVMLFGEKLKNLKICMHVSTTYCNPSLKCVEEKLYPAAADWKDAIRVAENCDENMLNVLTEKFLKHHPNTYTFTKGLSEQVVNDFRNRLPVVIYRPSIVISTIEEPVSGWLDNFNGPVGLLIACGIGLMRTSYANPDQISDYTPCDIAIKGMIMVAYKHALEKSKQKNQIEPVDVYNCCTSKVRYLTMGKMIDLGRDLAREVAFDKLLWAPGGGITMWRAYNYVRVIILHIIPAFFLDIGLKWSGQKPFVVKLQRRIYTANMALHYFMLNQWDFKHEKFMDINSYVTQADFHDFTFEKYKNYDVRMFYLNCAYGARKYLLHEKEESLPKARIHFDRMIILDKVVKYSCACIAIYLIFLYFGQNLFFIRSLCASIKLNN